LKGKEIVPGEVIMMLLQGFIDDKKKFEGYADRIDELIKKKKEKK
jgi:hypothetical protein